MISRSISAIIILAAHSYGYSQTVLPFTRLSQELDRVGSDTALITKTAGIDEYILWSNDEKFVALNFRDTWLKFDLTKVTLERVKWRGGLILGLNVNLGSGGLASEDEVKVWKLATKLFPREVTTKSGTKIELKEIGLGTALIITVKGQQPKTLWTTAMENCHSISLSPSEEFFTFISERNGAVIMKVPK